MGAGDGGGTEKTGGPSGVDLTDACEAVRGRWHVKSEGRIAKSGRNPTTENPKKPTEGNEGNEENGEGVVAGELAARNYGELRVEGADLGNAQPLARDPSGLCVFSLFSLTQGRGENLITRS